MKFRDYRSKSNRTNTFKTRLFCFLFPRGYETLFPNCRNSPRLANLVKQDKQGLRKEVTEGSNKRKWDIQEQTLVFHGFPVLLSVSDGEIEGKE